MPGLVPFEHTSGTSIRGKSRVSHFANKKAKRLLNLAASVAIQHNQELKQYYQRRVAEGKSKIGTLNIIRKKLVDRMFASNKAANTISGKFKHCSLKFIWCNLRIHNDV
ncbi:MAG: transposase [Chitinophagaceae bacterium]